MVNLANVSPAQAQAIMQQVKVQQYNANHPAAAPAPIAPSPVSIAAPTSAPVSVNPNDINPQLQPVSQTPLAMVQASPQTTLQNEFMQTPAYQLQYGQNYNMNPADRFQSDPGTQMAIQAGMQPLMASYAARGLGQSGALAQGLSQYMYNNYNNYTGNQANLFSNYQQQLAGLVNAGQANNGSNQANSNGNLLAQLLTSANLGTASSQSNANLATGQDISSLLANQGSLNASAQLNTGAAQSSNLMSGLNLAAQVGQAQQASNAGTLSSYYNGLGQQAGQTYLNQQNGGQGAYGAGNVSPYQYSGLASNMNNSTMNGMLY